MTEARQVDGDEVRMPGEPQPHLLEREDAFGPWTQENCGGVARPALCVAYGQAVYVSDLSLDGRVGRTCHDGFFIAAYRNSVSTGKYLKLEVLALRVKLKRAQLS
jgi:hypothetical protein